MLRHIMMAALAAAASGEVTQCRDTAVVVGADKSKAWRDSMGRSCAWYARFEGRHCERVGDRFEADGMTAHEACCECGGGDSVDSAETLPPMVESCKNLRRGNGEAWQDARGRNCARYARNGAKLCRLQGHRYERFGKTANDACCACGGGDTTRVCPPRVRKPYSELNCAERDEQVAAFATFREERAEEWHSFVDVHFAQFTYAHGTSSFLHWHRWYLINFENALRSMEGFECFTIAYWDWDKESGRETEALPLRADTFGSAAGLNEVPAVPFAPWRCVEDGIAAEWNTSFTPFQDMSAPRPRCLMRTNTVVEPARQFVPEEVLAGLIASFANFSEFRPAFEGAPHANPHIFIGGHMETPWSPNDPLFWMHHANVDRIFSVWQDYYGHDEVAKEDLVEPVHFSPAVDNRCEPAGCVDLAPQGLAPCPPGCNGTEVPGVCPPAPGCVVLPPGLVPCTQPFCNPTPDFALQADSPMAFGQFPAGPQGVPPPPFWLQGEVTARDMHRITEMTRESDRYTYGNCALAARLGEPLVGEWHLVTPAPAAEPVLDSCNEPQPCIMQCGTKVPHGWRGQGEGPENHESCNQVMCNDGAVIVLTRRGCINPPRCPPRESLHRAAGELSSPSRAELCEAAKAACPAGEVDLAAIEMEIRRMRMDPVTQGRFFTCQGLMAEHCEDL